jgi:hypothetical protein
MVSSSEEDGCLKVCTGGLWDCKHSALEKGQNLSSFVRAPAKVGIDDGPIGVRMRIGCAFGHKLHEVRIRWHNLPGKKQEQPFRTRRSPFFSDR